jgi:hypothetical protein
MRTDINREQKRESRDMINASVKGGDYVEMWNSGVAVQLNVNSYC